MPVSPSGLCFPCTIPENERARVPAVQEVLNFSMSLGLHNPKAPAKMHRSTQPVWNHLPVPSRAGRAERATSPQLFWVPGRMAA